MLDLIERPKVVQCLPSEIVAGIEDAYCRDLAIRSRPATLFYPIIFFIIWTTTSFRATHFAETLAATVFTALGLLFRIQFGWHLGGGFSERRASWARKGAFAFFCVSSSVGLLFARVLTAKPFSDWDASITLMWCAAAATSGTISFTPSFKMMRIHVVCLLLPAVFATLLAGGFRNNCYASSLAFFTLYVLWQGRQLSFSYWEQLVARHLEAARQQELLKAKVEAEEAQQRAECATRARSEFLANMSHEIRTPINAVVGMTSLLLNQDFDDETVSHLNTIRISSDSLLAIINDILDFSKIESGMLTLEQAPLALEDCVEEAVELLSAAADEKGLQLTSEIEPSIAGFILGDVTRLRQILVNLISNAVKFTAKGEVAVRVCRQCQSQRDELIFSVRDTGIGIPADRLDALFKSFTQVDSSITRRFGGTGLGLAISKRLTELMGGTIWIESKLSVGSTFSFTIPYQPLPAISPEEAELPHVRGKHVLLADRHPSGLAILHSHLQRWGMHVTSVTSERQVFDQLSIQKWDLLVLDREISEAVPTVREQLGPAAPPILILGAAPRTTQEQNATGGLPFSAHLAKPIRRKQLKRAIAQMFDRPTPQTPRPRAKLLNSNLARQCPLSILIAEDNLINQKVAHRLLEQLGYQTDLVGNGLEVLAALESRYYDCILLDIQMPEMDGIETARRICADRLPENRPWMIALTAGAMKGDRDECLQAGIHDYLAKPIKIQDLEKALQRCFSEIASRTSAAPAADLEPTTALVGA